MKTQPTPLPTPARPRSEKEWNGFRFTACSLDSEKVLNLPPTRKRAADGKAEEIQTTLGEIYKSLANCHTEIESWPGQGIIITTDTEKLVVAGLQFNCDVLKKLLELRSDGVNPFTADWFWYDRDFVRDMPQASYPETGARRLQGTPETPVRNGPDCSLALGHKP